MDARTRYLETLRFGRPDRVPLVPGHPRESTLAAWHQQGLQAGGDYRDALADLLDIPREAFETTVRIPISFRMEPPFEEKILAHRDGHYIVQDCMGAIVEIADTYDPSYLREAKDFVTRRWLHFPVSNRTDWERITWRYRPDDPRRFPVNWEQVKREIGNCGQATILHIHGPFWQLREWVGLETLCLLMVDDPQFVLEMVDFWRRFTLQLLARVLAEIHVDIVFVSEDMAYKAHSMISPEMARRFLLPVYRDWHALLSTMGCTILEMDSDGYVAELLPIWAEAGFNCCFPLEIAAGNDPLAYRQRFGHRIAFHGAIDKRALAKGGEEMRRAVYDIAEPLLADGGYLPSCDHALPSDIPWPHMVAYTDLLARLTGWR